MNAARIIYLTLVIVIACTVINFIRRSSDSPDFHIARILPFCSGEQVSVFDFAGLTMIVMTITSLRSLKRAENGNGQASRHYAEAHQHGRFRWWMVGLPATLLLAAWLISGIQPSVYWPDVAQAAGARDINAYGRLAILGIVLITIAIVRKGLTSK